MTRDDIIRWARSAIRLSADDASLMGFDQEATILDRYEFLHWFAKEAAASEREECAKVCDAESELRKDAAHKTHGNGSPAYGRQMSGVNAANNCAAAIRARRD